MRLITLILLSLVLSGCDNPVTHKAKVQQVFMHAPNVYSFSVINDDGTVVVVGGDQSSKYRMVADVPTDGEEWVQWTIHQVEQNEYEIHIKRSRTVDGGTDGSKFRIQTTPLEK